MEEHDNVKIIYDISQLVLSLTDEDFKELQEMVDGQKNYVHPLKLATQYKQHELGEHNQKMLNCIKELKQILVDGAPDK